MHTPPIGQSASDWIDSWRGREGNEFLRLWELNKPVIGAINGRAMGAGSWLALCTHITIASEQAVFAQPEVRHGSNTSFLWTMLAGVKNSLRYGLVGDHIDAQEALRIGLVTKIGSAKELIPTVEELAARMGEYPAEVLVATKKAAFAGRDMTTDQSHLFARALSAPLRDSDISREGVTAFAERRKANYVDSSS